jgi:hypothetical protein
MNLRLQSIATLVALLLMFWFSSAGTAAQLNEARVTVVVENVTLLSTEAPPRAAALNDRVRDNATVRTGDQSRAELTFSDQSVARLWAHTTLGLKDGARNLYLENGAVFLQIPRGAGVATIHGGGVAADVSGTSFVFEYHPNVFKFLVLEGTGRLYRPGKLGDSILVESGQLVFGNPKAALTDPVDFDISHFLKTSRFIMEFAPLRGAASIASEIQKQRRAKSEKTLLETNLVMYGGGTSVSAVSSGKIGTGTKASAESPTPTPTPSRSLSREAVNRSR